MDEFKEFDVIFDTATDLVAINSHKCTGCESPKYNVYDSIKDGTASLVSRGKKTV